MSRPPIKRPRRQLEGVQIRKHCLMAYVKVGGRQVSKSFAPDADPDDVQAWRADARRRLRREAREAKEDTGTLASEIDRFLALPYLTVGKRTRKPLTGRTKVDFEAWLGKWKNTRLARMSRRAITRGDVEEQLTSWQRDGTYAASSLNHLRQALIAVWRELDGPTHTCPAATIPKFDESGSVRRGFFEADQVAKVLAALPLDYRDVVEFAAFSGWRRQEIQGLTWSEVDQAGGVIRLSPERAKNRDGRVLPIVGPLVELIQRRAERRTELGTELPYVFTYLYGGQGKKRKTAARPRPIKDWRKRWVNACKAAGCGDALLHDFRRTVVRNLTRAQVPEKVAMQFTGHKTRAVFDRYNIVSEHDLKTAGERLTAFVTAQKKAPVEEPDDDERGSTQKHA